MSVDPAQVPSREEVLYYLGHRGQEVGDDLLTVIDEVTAEAADKASPRGSWRSFPLRVSADGIELEGSAVVLPGEAIAEHLAGATKAALLCVTAGPTPDLAQARLARRDPVRALVWDAVGSALVERAADACEREVVASAAAEGLVTGWRFSPGYGDLPLSVQPALLRALGGEGRLGVTLTDDLLMVPMKSVTAVVGIFRPEDARANGAARGACGTCTLRKNCALRAAGTPCWAGGRSQ